MFWNNIFFLVFEADSSIDADATTIGELLVKDTKNSGSRYSFWVEVLTSALAHCHMEDGQTDKVICWGRFAQTNKYWNLY